jgi:hypothetical protein
MSEPTSMLIRLMAAIWAALLSAGGAVLLILPLLLSGDQEGLAGLGIVMLAIGIGLGLIAALVHLRARVERARRTERAVAEIVRARLHTMTRIGVMLTYTLTLRFAPSGGAETELTRKVLVPPTHPLEPGKRVEILYDPANPGNFEPASAAEATPLRR